MSTNAMTDEERTVLRQLGDIDSEFSDIATFHGGVVGRTSRKVGGLWGEPIPPHVVESLCVKGWLEKRTTPAGWYRVTREGRKQAAAIFYGLDRQQDELIKALSKLIAVIDDHEAGEPARIGDGGSPGCIECTRGTVPNTLNTGLCPYHVAVSLVAPERLDYQVRGLPGFSEEQQGG